MTTREHEQTLNVWLAGLLRQRGLNARPEVTHPGNRRIDVEVRIGPAVIAVEAEHGQTPAKCAEAIRDADSRLAQNLAHGAVAVCYPDNTTEESLPESQFSWTVRDGVNLAPTWTCGDLDRLTSVIRLTPAQLGNPDYAAAALSGSLDAAVNRLSETQKRLLAQTLDLPAAQGSGPGSSSNGGQWNRAAKRALLVLATAVMFHSRLDSHLADMRPELDRRQNPPAPFTQHDLRYQQFDDNAKWLIRKQEKRIFASKPVHLSSIGNAFMVLADFMRKADTGTIAAVLPTATATHATALGIRRFLADSNHIDLIITSHDPERIYFSENTSIGEILVVCRRWPDSKGTKPPTTVVNLAVNPSTPADAMAVAWAISNGRVESQGYGTVQQWPASGIVNGDWGAVQFFSPYLCEFFDFSQLEKVANFGSINIRLTYNRSTMPNAGGMVALWDHKTDVTQSMAAIPDTNIVAKPGKEKQARNLWSKRGRLLLPTRVRLNTVRTLSVRLPAPAIGSAWVPCNCSIPNMNAELFEKALCIYLNSTIGVLALLSNRSNKVPSYPQFSLADMKKLIVPDLAAISAGAVERLAAVYDALSERTLLPLPQLDNDPVRRALDAAVVSALGLDGETVAAIRRHLAAEPSVTGRRYGA